MAMVLRIPLLVAVISWMPVAALGEQPPIEGEGSVLIGGMPAANSGLTGSSNVMIGGKPATTAGSVAPCGKIVVGGNASVLINGKPAASSGTPCQ